MAFRPVGLQPGRLACLLLGRETGGEVGRTRTIDQIGKQGQSLGWPRGGEGWQGQLYGGLQAGRLLDRRAGCGTGSAEEVPWQATPAGT